VTELSSLAVLVSVARTLEALEIPYAVGGSYASSMYGELRLTRDADLIVGLSSPGIASLADRLEHDFYVSRDAMSEAVRDSRSFNAVHLQTGFKIDFFVVGDAPFDRSELQRRVSRTVDPETGLHLWFKTAEDTVLRKLLWYRQGGEVSEQQWKDVLGVLRRMSRSLDRAYLETWAARIEVRDLLERAFHDAEPQSC
jgi:hypothetical protein